jgi:Uma2 family endonuclease
MSRTQVIIGPADRGRRMTLDEFEFAEAREGHRYELGRGVVVVTDVPNPKHFAQIMAVKRAFMRQDLDHPGMIYGVATGSECKILVESAQSERHPDLAIYLTPPPAGLGRQSWRIWVPEIVIEIVSPGSHARDYEEKPSEYWEFGVKEYLVVDAQQEQVTLNTRGTDTWVSRQLSPGETYETPLLPGLRLAVGDVFAAARGVP